MYCPRCQKSIGDNRIAAIAKELKETMGNTMLEQGKCPVCGTELVRQISSADGQGSS